MNDTKIIESRIRSLRTFRGYTEDEAELAVWAADIVETAQAHLLHTATFCHEDGPANSSCPTWTRLQKALHV